MSLSMIWGIKPYEAICKAKKKKMKAISFWPEGKLNNPGLLFTKW